ncbi:MAG: EF-P lysine aminoacylase GenX [Candidatus Magasanikbacteria bacterium]|nr:EF-P lysine aminoacylase GenX [Candidatus Magasanikbacteria bacterium]
MTIISRDILKKRAKIISAIRDFFNIRDFLEVETPTLVKCPGMEPYLNPFETVLWDEQGHEFPAYLTTSPEYAMKKLLAGGLEKIYCLGKVFRNNEPLGGTHNPEFTMIEWYRIKADYFDVMKDVEEMVFEVARVLGLGPQINYAGRTIDLMPPWTRLSMRAAWQKYADVNLDDFLDRGKMIMLAREKGYDAKDDDTFDDAFFRIFLTEIEPALSIGERPVFLYDYPVQMAALSEKCVQDPHYAQRFEVYVGGMELGNAFTELRDADEQERRLREEQDLRRALGKKVFEIDRDFLNALRSGFPPTGGIAFGVDRLVMLLLNKQKIDEVIFNSTGELFGA